MNKATEKQINFIKEIIKVLFDGEQVIDVNNLTKQQASDFISKYIEKYKIACIDYYYDWEIEKRFG